MQVLVRSEFFCLAKRSKDLGNFWPWKSSSTHVSTIFSECCTMFSVCASREGPSNLPAIFFLHRDQIIPVVSQRLRCIGEMLEASYRRSVGLRCVRLANHHLMRREEKKTTLKKLREYMYMMSLSFLNKLNCYSSTCGK